MPLFSFPIGAIHAFGHYSGIGFALLFVGALMTAAVGVSVFSFYVDEYWADEDLRETLRRGSKNKRKLS